MRKAICEIAASAVFAFVLVGTYCQTFAQESEGKNPSSSVAISTSEETPAFATNEVLYRTYIFHGSGPSIPAGTWTAVDSPHTIQCPGTTGSCTITADISVQEGGGSVASNTGAVALEVDGSLVCNSDPSNGCHYALRIPPDGRFGEANELNSLSGVAAGAHTVQTFVYADDGASGGFYNIRYAVYRP